MKSDAERIAELESTLISVTAAAHEMDTEMTALEKKLASSQLSAKAMREALEAVLVMWHAKPPRKLDEHLCWRDNDEKAQRMADEALSHPTDTSALDRYVEKVLEEARKKWEKEPQYLGLDYKEGRSAK